MNNELLCILLMLEKSLSKITLNEIE